MKRKPTVLLDVDGVLADFAGAVLRWAGPQHSREHLTQWDMLKALGIEHRQERLDEFASEPGFCESLEVLPGAHEFVAELQEVAHVVVVTSPYAEARLWTFERLRWLDRNFGIEKQNVIFAKRKELVRGDLLLDDKPENVEAFALAGGRALLMHQPWNAGYLAPDWARWPGSIIRCNNHEEALGAIHIGAANGWYGDF